MAERRVGDRGADGKPAVAGQGAAGLGENAQATASYPETGSGAVFQNATRQHVGTISGNIADPELHVDLVATDRHGTVGLIDRASSGIGRAVVTTHGRAGTRDRGQIERAGAVQVKYRPAGGATHLEADAGSGVTAAASVVDHSRIDDGRSGASVGTAQGRVPEPFLIIPALPAKTDPMAASALTVMVGVVPPRLMAVPPDTV